MSTILSKIVVISFTMVIVTSTAYFFLISNPNIDLGVVYQDYEVLNFKSYDDLNFYLQNSYDSYNRYYSSDWGLSVLTGSDTIDEYSQDIKGSGEVDNDYSGTNIQEIGVDEPDIVKTDGTYLFVISDLNLYIVYAFPAEEARIVSTITFNESNRPNNIFINDDKLAVITQSYVYLIYEEYDDNSLNGEKIWQDTTKTHVFIYDLSDIEKPIEVYDIEIDGYYSNARMIDDYVYVITTQYAYDPILYMDEESSYIPKINVNKKEEIIGLTDIYYINSPDISKTLTNIVSFNIMGENIDVTAEVFIIGTPSTIYVSTDNIFITSISYDYDYKTIYDLLIEYVLPYLSDEVKNELNIVDTLSIDDNQKITISEWIIQNYIEKLDDEQKLKIAKQLILHFEKTIIHKITINNGEIDYDSQGTVPGYVKNQFSISEYNGYLRVATTINGWMMRPYLSSIESYSNVFIFDENFEIIGYIEDIAPGEEIYSVRFQDDKCYLVTFKQIDPFFVIDLQDPRNPMILGELKIPGYSTYLHPYDSDNIIGIGLENNSVKLSIFNVEDVLNPKELSTYQIQQKTEEYSWSYSTALYEHKAFLFDKEKDLLIIPISIDYKESAYVFNIIDNKFDLIGIITHESDDNNTELKDDYIDSYWINYYSYSIKRSLFIEDVIYTISDAIIKMNDINTLNELNSIFLI